MKKITLSAAIMALAMMGCSDAGLDNSVASTSEVSVEQVQSSANEPLVLAKLGAMPNYHAREAINNLQPTGGNWYSDHDGYARYQYPNYPIDVEMQTRVDLDWDGYEGQGEFHVLLAPFKPNAILVVSAIVSDCELYDYYNDGAYCQKALIGVKYVDNDEYSDDEKVDHVLVHTELDAYGRKIPQAKFYKELGAVSAFVGVWGSGAEIVLGWATYAGGGFEEANGPKMARAVYKSYVLPEINKELNNKNHYKH